MTDQQYEELIEKIESLEESRREDSETFTRGRRRLIERIENLENELRNLENYSNDLYDMNNKYEDLIGKINNTQDNFSELKEKIAYVYSRVETFLTLNKGKKKKSTKKGMDLRAFDYRLYEREALVNADPIGDLEEAVPEQPALEEDDIAAQEPTLEEGPVQEGPAVLPGIVRAVRVNI